jgi:hypothetical protein
MALRKLRQLDSKSAGVTIPKEELRDCGLLDENGQVEGETFAHIKKVGKGKWEVETINLG